MFNWGNNKVFRRKEVLLKMLMHFSSFYFFRGTVSPFVDALLSNKEMFSLQSEFSKQIS